MPKPKKYIFCINTGRSGSHYLTEISRAVKNSVAVHEDQPFCAGLEMNEFNNGNELPMKKALEIKLGIIAAKTGKGRKAYLESNHTFIKGFGWLLPEYISQEDIGVIVLKREPEKISESLKRIRCIPGKTRWARTWYLSPGMKRNLSEPAPGYTDDEACNWYISEIERRGEAYRKAFPGITFADVELENLNDIGFVSALFENSFGLEVDKVLLKEKIKVRPYELNTEFNAPPDNAGLKGLVNPDILSADAQEALRNNILHYLKKNYYKELFQKKEPVIGPWKTVIPSVISTVTARESELMEVFKTDLPQTDFEINLMIWLVHRLRLMDPYGLIHVRQDEHYWFPAMNKNPVDTLGVMFFNFFRILKERVGN